MALNRILYISRGVFTDAGGWYIGADGKIHRVPGWNPESMAQVAHSLDALRNIGQLKAPGLVEKLAPTLMESVRKDLGDHVKDGDVLVIGH